MKKKCVQNHTISVTALNSHTSVMYGPQLAVGSIFRSKKHLKKIKGYGISY